MKKKVLFIVLPIILVIVIIAAVIIGILVNKNKKEEAEEESIDSKWGNTYYAYLKSALKEDDDSNLESSYGLSKNIEEGKIQFCKIEDEENPRMILTYKDGDNTGVNVYQINNDSQVNKNVYKNKATLRYLYDLETETYGWFVCETDENGRVFISMKNIGTSDEEKNVIKIENKETTVSKDNNDVTITEFDKKFIEPKTEQINYFDFSFNMKEEELKNGVQESVKIVEENKDVVSEEQKQVVSDREKELKEIIKTISEIAQRNKEIVGTWGLNTNLKSSSTNIMGLMQIFGSGLRDSTNELTLKEDGTFTFYVGLAYNTTGKYKFENNTLTVYDVKDPEIKDTKQLMEELKFEYIKHNNHEFFKLDVTNITNAETYIFFEKEPAGNQGYMSDEVPSVKFKTPVKAPETTNTQQNNNTATSTNSSASSQSQETTNTSNNSSKIKVGNYTLDYGTYKGTEHQFDAGNVTTYENTIKLNSDGTYTYSTTNPNATKNTSGKYTAGTKNSSPCITFDSGSWLLVTTNNLMMEPAGSGTTYTYQGK